MAFLPYSSGTGTEHAVLVEVTIANSATVAVGELVKTDSSGFLTNATAANSEMGIVVGFASSSDSPLSPTAYAAGTATSTDVQSVTAASDNQTVAKKMAIVNVSTKQRWSAAVNGTIGSTNASGKIGALIDVDSANTNYGRVLESTATRTYTTATNFFVWGTDPNDSTRLIVSLRASQTQTGGA